MSNLRPGEQKFIDEWAEYYRKIPEFKSNRVPNENNINHFLWMIINKDTIGGDAKTVRRRQTKVINPISSMRRNRIVLSNLTTVQADLIDYASRAQMDITNPEEDTPSSGASLPSLNTPINTPQTNTPQLSPRTARAVAQAVAQVQAQAPVAVPVAQPAQAPVAQPAPAPGVIPPAPTERDLQIAQESKLPQISRSSRPGIPTQATPSQRFNQQPGFRLTPVVPTTAPPGFQSTPDDIGRKKLTDLTLKEIKEYNDFQRPLPEILERQNTIYQTKLRQGLTGKKTHPFGDKYNIVNEAQINYNVNSDNPFIKAQARLKVKEIDETSRIYRPQLQEAIDNGKTSAKVMAKMSNMTALNVKVPVQPPFKAKGFDAEDLNPVFKIQYTHGIVPQFMSEKYKKKRNEVVDLYTSYIKDKQMKDASDLFFD